MTFVESGQANKRGPLERGTELIVVPMGSSQLNRTFTSSPTVALPGGIQFDRHNLSFASATSPMHMSFNLALFHSFYQKNCLGSGRLERNDSF